MANVVFPIPPGPNIVTRAGSPSSMSTRVFNSDSRPWKIFGEAGSKENDPELSEAQINKASPFI
jgi:hypothetical protein